MSTGMDENCNDDREESELSCLAENAVNCHERRGVVITMILTGRGVSCHVWQRTL